ncbi:MAG: hypothetical protein A2049_01895 [Elusimicrobia bacterium GWA2_62_23]|nr:MAG: hypothetical protein A2049_01895 [Elusimicrobia bacterium GWA2_62_23]
MKTSSRLRLIVLAASLSPLLVFFACAAAGRPWFPHAAVLAAAAALAVSLLAAEAAVTGLAGPMASLASGIRRFIAADYKLEAVLPQAGWPEAGALISAVNRLMLELGAYRAFHLNQVVEERAKAQALLDTIGDAVLLLDDRNRLICSNAFALRLLGIRKAEPELELCALVRRKDFLPVLARIAASEENYLKMDVDVPGAEEEYAVTRNFRVTSRRFRLAGLARPGRVVVIRDVTVDREIESARETFFHMITHDMRAPVTSIQGYTQLLTEIVPQSPAVERCLLPIMRSARRLNGMIEDILNTIKLERGELKLKADGIDAGALCDAVFEVHEPLAAAKRIKLSAAPLPAKIRFRGDAALLERVLVNLVGNSLKFTPAGGNVALSCRAVAGEALFTVEDDGPGIPREKREEIFEKYSQLEEHKHMGLGLGLAMCRLAVQAHNGRIWVESEEGKGSRFMFVVPLTASGKGTE